MPSVAVEELPDGTVEERIDAAVAWYLDALQESGTTWIAAADPFVMGRDPELEAILTEAENTTVDRVLDAVAGEVLLRQVHAPAVEVLADVAQEVRQLERVPERACRLLRRRRERLQHGQHHLPDHGGGALHVAVAQLLPGGPGGAGQVELHRPEEPVEILRTLHSFDPCLACSTHVMSPEGEELTEVKVR